MKTALLFLLLAASAHAGFFVTLDGTSRNVTCVYSAATDAPAGATPVAITDDCYSQLSAAHAGDVFAINDDGTAAVFVRHNLTAPEIEVVAKKLSAAWNSLADEDQVTYADVWLKVKAFMDAGKPVLAKKVIQSYVSDDVPQKAAFLTLF